MTWVQPVAILTATSDQEDGHFFLCFSVHFKTVVTFKTVQPKFLGLFTAIFPVEHQPVCLFIVDADKQTIRISTIDDETVRTVASRQNRGSLQLIEISRCYLLQPIPSLFHDRADPFDLLILYSLRQTRESIVYHRIGQCPADESGLLHPYIGITLGSQRHIQRKPQGVFFADAFQRRIVINNETQTQHPEHLFEQNAVNLRKSMVTVDDDRVEG